MAAPTDAILPLPSKTRDFHLIRPVCALGTCLKRPSPSSWGSFLVSGFLIDALYVLPEQAVPGAVKVQLAVAPKRQPGLQLPLRVQLPQQQAVILHQSQEGDVVFSCYGVAAADEMLCLDPLDGQAVLLIGFPGRQGPQPLPAAACVSVHRSFRYPLFFPPSALIIGHFGGKAINAP